MIINKLYFQLNNIKQRSFQVVATTYNNINKVSSSEIVKIKTDALMKNSSINWKIGKYK